MSKVPCPHCLGTGTVPDNQKLAQQAVNTRKVNGLTQKQVAEAMKISQGYLNDLEHSRRDWNWELWCAMRKACLTAKKKGAV